MRKGLGRAQEVGPCAGRYAVRREKKAAIKTQSRRQERVEERRGSK